MKKIGSVLCFLLLLIAPCFAQLPEISKLKVSLTTLKNDSLKYVDVLNRLAILVYEKNVDSTFYFARNARQIASRHGYKKGETDALNNLGIFFHIKGNLQLALRYYNEARVGYSDIKDTVNSVQSVMNIAMVYKDFGRHARAIQRFDAAMSIGKNLSQDSIMSLVIYNYLLFYPEKFKGDLKIDYINKAREIASRYKDKRMLVAIDQLVADDLIARGERDKGLALLASAIDSAIKKQLYYASMDMLIDMGDKLATTQPSLAAVQYKKALALAGENGFLIYSQIFAKKLFDLYSLQGNQVTVATYSRQLVNLYEQQNKINNTSSIDYLDYVLKDQQVAVLKTNSKYHIALLALLSIACLLAIAVLIVVRNNLKRTKKLNAQVTDQNHQMKDTLGALLQSQQDNTNMLSIVAHDLRSPIIGIHAATLLMLDDNERSADDKEILKLMKSSSEDSLELVENLLHTQLKTETLKKTTVDLSEMLRYCVALLKSSAEAKEQHISLTTQQVTLSASREKLWRVATNLIGNAIKFSPNQTTIEVKMETEDSCVKIAVIDEGIGIPTEIENKIFDIFTQVRRKGTAGEQPFGLGLAISKQIIEAHGGKIWFERRPVKGTSFFITLPFPS
jgi:signal transduction histidine kinase